MKTKTPPKRSTLFEKAWAGLLPKRRPMAELTREPPLSPERDFLAEAEEMLEHLERYQELLEEVKDDSDFPQFTVWGQHLLMTVGYLAASIRRLEENILNMRLESGRHYD